MKKSIILFLVFGITKCYTQTWNPIISPTNLNINSCSFVSQDTGWVITSDSIFKTINGGISWISQNYPPDPPNDARFFNSVHFINSNIGVIACGNYLYTGHDPSLVSNFLWTNDGGNNWVYKNLGTSTDYILDAKLSSSTTAYGIGQYGQLTSTTDGGNNWTDLSYTSQYSGTKLFPISEDTVYFAGLANISNKAAFGKIINFSWSASTILNTTPSSFLSLYFFNHLTGWICGTNGNLYKTTDGGLNWTSNYSGVNSTIRDILFTDWFNGWFITNDGKIYHSSNSGLNWNLEYNGISLLTDITFVNNFGYAVGYGGIILKYFSNSGLEEKNEISSLKVFPNPSNDIIFIQLDNFYSYTTTFTIYNTLGKTVLKQNLIEKNSRIDLSALESGVYFILINNGSATTSMKIIKTPPNTRLK